MIAVRDTPQARAFVQQVADMRAKNALQTAAAGLIASKRTKSGATPLSAHAVEQLRELVEYNDGVRGSSNRVSWRAACAMLRDHFGWVGGADSLNAICRAQLGRKSWSQK